MNPLDVDELTAKPIVVSIPPGETQLHSRSFAREQGSSAFSYHQMAEVKD